MPFCLQSKLFHLFVFITAKSRPMSGHVWRKHRSFSTAFTFNASTVFSGDFPHLNFGRDLQIFDAPERQLFRVLLIGGGVPGLWGILPAAPFPGPPPLIAALFLRGCQAWMLRYIEKDFSGI